MRCDNSHRTAHRQGPFKRAPHPVNEGAHLTTRCPRQSALSVKDVQHHHRRQSGGRLNSLRLPGFDLTVSSIDVATRPVRDCPHTQGGAQLRWPPGTHVLGRMSHSDTCDDDHSEASA